MYPARRLPPGRDGVEPSGHAARLVLQAVRHHATGIRADEAGQIVGDYIGRVGMKHPLFVQRAITIVVQALSSLGSSRLVAICTSSLRSPPRTTGQ